MIKNSISINKLWWDNLVAKKLLQRRQEVEHLLEQFIKTDPYGKEWLKVARREDGIFRVKPGQHIPVIHLTFIGKNPGFMLPIKQLQAGHRTVRTDTTFQSNSPLSHNEKVLQPTITVELVTDPIFIAAAGRKAITIDESQINQPSQLVSIPAHYLLSSNYLPRKSYVLYQHIFGHGGSYPNDGYFYVGVTTRSWQKRWAEHKGAVNSGSPLLFHKRYREQQAAGRLTYVHHKVMAITDDIEQLYDSEEFLVKGHWEDERRLNMIPGGKSGLKYLRENGLLSRAVVPMPDERDKIVQRWLKDNPRKGLPAPWVTRKWQEDEWAIAQICGRKGRLSVEQVKAIRQLTAHYSDEVICERIGAKDVGQVRRVIDGKTYSRVT